VLRDLLGGKEYAGHIGVSVVAVLADNEGLPTGAEQHFLVGFQSAHTHRVHMNASRADATACAGVDLLLGLVRCPLALRCCHAFNCAHSRSARRVGFAVVVHFDDFSRLEERRSQLGEAHHEDRTDSEIGHDHAVRSREGVFEQCQIIGSKTRRANQGMDAMQTAPRHVRASRFQHREVDGDLNVGINHRLWIRAYFGTKDRPANGMRVDGSDQVQFGVGTDSRAHGLPHLAARTKHTHSNRHAETLDSGGPRF
jgi:hypothetical protein